ncbi:glycosyltransferase, partial [Klebsiella pneumoniae]|nr:glycosyltransferase [Klebsiella pneumoniae]
MKNYGVISILMGTYNGGKFLRQQLDSIISQTYDNWVLYISDDGSTDNTLDIVSEYANKVPEGKIVVRSGPGTGFANNFLSMLRDPQIIS